MRYLAKRQRRNRADNHERDDVGVGFDSGVLATPPNEPVCVEKTH